MDTIQLYTLKILFPVARHYQTGFSLPVLIVMAV